MLKTNFLTQAGNETDIAQKANTIEDWEGFDRDGQLTEAAEEYFKKQFGLTELDPNFATKLKEDMLFSNEDFGEHEIIYQTADVFATILDDNKDGVVNQLNYDSFLDNKYNNYYIILIIC